MSEKLSQSLLKEKQRLFCAYYVETGNIKESAIRAGYSAKTAAQMGSVMLTKPKIINEIERLREIIDSQSIAKGKEVMEYFTAVMRGEVKDQFGLESSLSERTKAAQELAKRTIDIDNRLAGRPDSMMEIKLNWKR